MLSLEIQDDGHGITPEALGKADSFGLRGLAERAKAAGGWLEILPARRGTTLLLTVPLAGAPVQPATDDDAPGRGALAE